MSRRRNKHPGVQSTQCMECNQHRLRAVGAAAVRGVLPCVGSVLPSGAVRGVRGVPCVGCCRAWGRCCRARGRCCGRAWGAISTLCCNHSAPCDAIRTLACVHYSPPHSPMLFRSCTASFCAMSSTYMVMNIAMWMTDSTATTQSVCSLKRASLRRTYRTQR